MTPGWFFGRLRSHTHPLENISCLSAPPCSSGFLGRLDPWPNPSKPQAKREPWLFQGACHIRQRGERCSPSATCRGFFSHRALFATWSEQPHPACPLPLPRSDPSSQELLRARTGLCALSQRGREGEAPCAASPEHHAVRWNRVTRAVASRHSLWLQLPSQNKTNIFLFFFLFPLLLEAKQEEGVSHST